MAKMTKQITQTDTKPVTVPDFLLAKSQGDIERFRKKIFLGNRFIVQKILLSMRFLFDC